MNEKIIQIPKDRIDEIFKRNDKSDNPHQATVLVELYMMVIPEWDRITKINNGWPIVTRETNEHLFRKFMDFDDKHHNKKGRQGVMRGGLWMNNGFSVNAEPVPLELSPLPHFHAYVGHLDYEYIVEG